MDELLALQSGGSVLTLLILENGLGEKEKKTKKREKTQVLTLLILENGLGALETLKELT